MIKIRCGRFLSFMVLLFLGVVTPISVLAEEATSNHEKANTNAEKVFDNMKKNASDQFNDIMELETPTNVSKDDAFNWLDSMSYKLLYGWYRLREAAKRVWGVGSLFCIIFGLLWMLIFRKDKPKKKWGIFLSFSGPAIFFIIIYGPAVVAYFQN